MAKKTPLPPETLQAVQARECQLVNDVAALRRDIEAAQRGAVDATAAAEGNVAASEAAAAAAT